MGGRLALKQAGRFAVYPFGDQLVLCGFAGPDGIEIAKLESDPAAVLRTPCACPAKPEDLLGRWC